MKKLLYFTILLLSIHLNAQQIQWEKTLGGAHADYLFDAMPTLDYGFILVGGSLSNDTGDVGVSAGDYDYFITKISEFGDTEWTTTIGGDKSDIIKSITNTFDGGYLIAGISNSKKGNDKEQENIGQQDIWLIKINITGGIEWQKTLGGLANDTIADVIKTKQGGFLIAGTSASSDYIENEKLLENPNIILKSTTNKGNLDYWVIKLDVSGELLWQQTFGGKYKDELRKIVELPDETIVLAGVSNSPMGQDKQTINKGLTDWWLLKLDKQGNSIWQKAFGDDGDDQLYALVQTKDEKLLVGGNFRNKSKNGNGDSDFVVKKLDVDGAVIWENTYSEGTNDILTDIVQNNDGSYLLSGYTASEKTQNLKSKIQNPKKGTEDFLVIKINAEGEEQWRKNLGTDKKEVLHKSIKTRDGGYVLMGTSMPLDTRKNNNANFYMVKLLDKDKPEHIKLPIETVPNPTRDYTQIIIGQEYKDGTLIVADFSGRILQNFSIENKRIIPVNLESYPDGVYIISVKTDVASNSVKIAKISN